MKKKTIIKAGIIMAVAGVVVAGAIGFYLFNMPHRDVQSAKADFSLASSQIVAEYLSDAGAANEKYLSADGDSKILEVSGTVSKISENFNGEKVVLLMGPGDRAGVSAAFTSATSANAEKLQPGQNVTIKGVIRSGASYDKDLDLWENVVLEKSGLATK